jgi:hypothetical protein
LYTRGISFGGDYAGEPIGISHVAVKIRGKKIESCHLTTSFEN